MDLLGTYESDGEGGKEKNQDVEGGSPAAENEEIEKNLNMKMIRKDLNLTPHVPPEVLLLFPFPFPRRPPLFLLSFISFLFPLFLPSFLHFSFPSSPLFLFLFLLFRMF